jgi:hypothetical protein
MAPAHGRIDQTVAAVRAAEHQTHDRHIALALIDEGLKSDLATVRVIFAVPSGVP